MEESRTVKFKSKRFAVRVVNLYKYLCNEKKEYVLSKQVLRSGTSIGANIAESECAISERDFLSKIYIALKECCRNDLLVGLAGGNGLSEKSGISISLFGL